MESNGWESRKPLTRGRTWKLVWKEDSNPSAKPGANVHDAWITEQFGSDWGENPLALSVADQDANLVYATDLGRTMRTTDGGANWNAVYSRKSGDKRWTTTGLDVTTSYGYHFDPFDHNRQFISTTDIGLFRSEDGGKSWTIHSGRAKGLDEHHLLGGVRSRKSADACGA